MDIISSNINGGKMYKLIIVDDEYLIRKGLTQYIKWASLGFEVVGSFEDGLSALNYLRQNRVDVVLADIDMPIMNGIQLVEHVRKNDFASHCVIISGYQDFDYARKLIHLQVKNYLLKPIENEVVIETFLSIKELLDDEKERTKNIESDRKMLQMMRSTLFQQFFTDLFIQKTSLAMAQKYLERFDLGFDENDVNIFYTQIKIDNLQELLDGEWHYGIDALYDSVTNYIKGLMPSFKIVDFQKGRNLICVVGIFANDAPLNVQMEEYKTFTNQIVTGIHEMSKIKLSVISIQGFKGLQEVCENAPGEEFKSCDLSATENSDNTLELQGPHDEQLSYIYNAINSAFVARDLTDVNERVDLLYEKTKHFLLSDAREVYNILMQILVRHIDQNSEISYAFESKLYECENVYDMSVYAKKYIEHIKQYVPSNPDNQLRLLIDQAKIYINNNYSKNISRNDVSDYMFLSASYFSRCFKQQTGMKFIDYLTNLRIQKSCELLLDPNNKISDVCEAVGYNSPSYFARVFKCVMGITPHEYIRANIQQA